MAKKNQATPFIRQCVGLWLASCRTPKFSIADIIAGLQRRHASLQALDLSKAVSNELVRLEYVGKLTSEPGTFDDGCGIGRPPKLYTKRICKASLVKMKRRTVVAS